MKQVGMILLLAVVGFLTYWFVFREEKIEFDPKESNFSIKDTAAITTIFLADKQGNKIKLSRDKHHWLINDSFLAWQPAVTNLLDALYNQRAEQPVPAISHDNVIKDLAVYAVKTEVYQGNKCSRVFYVGKNPSPTNLTYMLYEGAKRPYTVRIPIHNYFLGIRYMTKVHEWRDKKVLTASPNEISSISLDYKDSIRHSFKLILQDTNVSITGNFPVNQSPDKRIVTAYLSTFGDLYCLGFENMYSKKDSIIQYGKQIATFVMTRKDGSTEKAVFYYKPVRQGTKKIIEVGKEEYDGDSYFAYINDRDLVVFYVDQVESILRSYIDFFNSGKGS